MYLADEINLLRHEVKDLIKNQEIIGMQKKARHNQNKHFAGTALPFCRLLWASSSLAPNGT